MGTSSGATRRSLAAVSVVAALSLVVGACGAAATPTPSREVSPSPAPSASPSPSPEPSTRTACPGLSAGGAIASDRLVSIELEEAADRDLVVFRFDGSSPSSAPTVRLEPVEPPFVQDPSGLPLPVDGERFLRVRFDGMWLYDDAGVPTRTSDEPLVGDPPAVVEVARESEFEGVSGWIVGMVGSGCLGWEARGDELVLVVEP